MWKCVNLPAGRQVCNAATRGWNADFHDCYDQK